MAEEKYCRRCNRKELRSNCRYGGSSWDRFTTGEDPDEGDAGESGGVGESVVINDASGKAFANVVDIIRSKNIRDYYNISEAVRIPAKTGHMVDVYLNWRGKYISMKMFFPDLKMPNKGEIQDEIIKAYPGARVVTYKASQVVPGQPFLQIEGYDEPREKLKTDRDMFNIPKKERDAAKERLLAKAKEKRAKLGEDMSGMSQRSGDKRSTKSGAGMTAQGVAKYNRRTGGNLKTAVTTPPSKLKPGSKAAKRRKSFCARSRSWTGERGRAARRRWNC